MTLGSRLRNSRIRTPSSNARSSYRGEVTARPLRQSMRELCACLDVEFAERLAKVVLHGARAEEQSSGDLSVGVAVRREARDLHLLRSELVSRIHASFAGTLARRVQLEPCALGERLHPK